MTNDQQPFEPYPARREGTPRGLIRASDADRERVAVVYRAHLWAAKRDLEATTPAPKRAACI